MGCETCGDKKPACDKGFTKATLEIKNPSQLVEFRKIVVPASLGDDTAVPPVVGKYCNAILYYEANDQVYLYSSDGIPTKITVDIEELKRQIKKVADDLADETQARTDADAEIWEEIETIEAASDVVDVVGTYAELQAYDTSKLHDKDLIKVLCDETRDDAITYYRWSTSTSSFSYVGAEGPYYTASETDTLLAAKQDTLIAGANIQIASDGKTISATDTTYTHFTGATASTDGVQGLVPGPLAGDEDKVLKGDGTWGKVSTETRFYSAKRFVSATNYTFPMEVDFYTDVDLTTPVTLNEVVDASKKGDVILCETETDGNTRYPKYEIRVVSETFSKTNYQGTIYDVVYFSANYTDGDRRRTYYIGYTPGAPYGWRVWITEMQPGLTAGSNIQINGNTISATDTTYTASVGIDITNNRIKSVSVLFVTFDSPSAGYAVLRAETTPLDVMNVHDYIDRFGSNVMLALSDYEYATLIGKLPSELGYLHYLFEYGTLIYDFAVGLNDTKYTIIDTQAAMTGASAGAAGAKGLVPAPAAGDQGKFLQGDGTWATITAPTYADFTGATSSVAGAHGLVPAPTTSDPDKFLKGDGTWSAIPVNNISSTDWNTLWQ